MAADQDGVMYQLRIKMPFTPPMGRAGVVLIYTAMALFFVHPSCAASSGLQDSRKKALPDLQTGGSASLDSVSRALERLITSGKTREEAIYELGKVRRKALTTGDPKVAKEIEDFLLSALSAPDDPLAVSAGAALTHLEPRSARAIPILNDLVLRRDLTDHRVFGVLRQLQYFGKQATTATQSLLGVMNDRSKPTRLRCAAATTLAAVSSDTNRVAAALVQIANDNTDSFPVRCATAIAARKMDPEISQSLLRTLLIEMRKSRPAEKAESGLALIIALAALEPDEQTVELLAQIAEDPNETAQFIDIAMHALSNARTHGRKAVPALTRILTREHPSSPLFTRAIRTLSALGPAAASSKEFLAGLRANVQEPRLARELDTAIRLISAND